MEPRPRAAQLARQSLTPARYAQRSACQPAPHRAYERTLRITPRCSYGGPLSPLLSNIVLDELDRELDRRGHRFVRYADDAKVYVRSERAGQRVMASLCEFIQRRLRLKVNQAKSAVARPEERHFLGFRLWVNPYTGVVEVLLSERAKRLAMERIRQLTPRNWGGTLESCIAGANAWLCGWHGFFGIASATEMRMMRTLDAHIRRRLRAIILRHWKRKRTIARRLIKLGVKRENVWRQIYSGRKSWWALSHTSAVDHGLRNAYFAKRGLLFWPTFIAKRTGRSSLPPRHNWRYGNDSRSTNRPAAGVITRRPEEPYTTSVRTVLWEPGRVTAPATRRSGDGRGALAATPGWVRAARRRVAVRRRLRAARRPHSAASTAGVVHPERGVRPPLVVVLAPV